VALGCLFNQSLNNHVHLPRVLARVSRARFTLITDKQAEAAVSDIEQWAGRLAASIDPKVQASVYYDADSSTYVLRLAKGSRVLLFRLSDAQVSAVEREAECEKILTRKIKDLSS
jgi:hypothetical protein